MPHYGDYQNQIYFAGLNGVVPTTPVDWATLQHSAPPPPCRRPSSPTSRAAAGTSTRSGGTRTPSPTGASCRA